MRTELTSYLAAVLLAFCSLAAAGNEPTEGEGQTPDTLHPISIADDMTITADSTEYEGQDITIDGASVIIDGSHHFQNLRLINGAMVTHAPGTRHPINLNITGTLALDATSKIDVSARGQLPSAEVGSYSGGSYGGSGGIDDNSTTNASYGSYLEQVDLGMGGRGYYNDERTRGGGAIKIVANRLALSGKILANGQHKYDHGTGSGGSIWLDVGILQGDEAGKAGIESNGGTDGAHRIGGGSGGRIAIYYASLERFDLTSQVSAKGTVSTFAQSGAAGTIYLKEKTSASDRLLIDNRGVDLSKAASVPLQGTLPSRVIIKNSKIEQVGEITVDRLEITDSIWEQNGHGLSVTTDYRFANSQFIHNGEFTLPGNNLVVDGYTYSLQNSATWDKVEVINGGVITTPAEVSVTLTANELIIDAGSRIDVSARGRLPSEAVGRRTGGSYGGSGGIHDNSTTNASYGSYLEPVDLGTGGRRYGDRRTRGGGAIKIVANRLALSGKIFANGQYADYHGTGSGGSIWLDVGTLQGDEAGKAGIESNGGAGNHAYGGGSGGRIAIYYASLERFDLTSQVSAKGAVSRNAQSGENGTIYTEQINMATAVVSTTAHGFISAVLDKFTVTFINKIEPTSFTVDDISLTGNGQTIPVSGIDKISGIEYRISFSAPLPDGQYELTIGPDILALNGRGMDQDGDGIEAEAEDDLFIARFQVDRTQPAAPTVHLPVAPKINQQASRQLTLSGERENNTAIVINSVERVAIGSGAWAVDIVLKERDNTLSIVAVDRAGNRSDAVELLLNVDTTPPVLGAFTPRGAIRQAPPRSITGIYRNRQWIGSQCQPHVGDPRWPTRIRKTDPGPCRGCGCYLHPLNPPVGRQLQCQIGAGGSARQPIAQCEPQFCAGLYTTNGSGPVGLPKNHSDQYPYPERHTGSL